MPDTLESPPPAAPAAAPAPKTTAQVAADAARTTVNVGAIAPAAEAPPPAKPGSAMARMREELEKRATVADPSSPTTRPAPRNRPGIAKADDPPKPAASTADDPAATKTGDAPPADGAQPKPTDGQPPAATTQQPATDPKTGKVNPWRLVDDWKGRATKAETRITELEKTGFTPEAKTQLEQRVQQAEKRAADLEREIVFYDYSKSQEFSEKYDVPYQQSWTRAMSDLKELTVEDGNGGQRPFTANDLLALVNLPITKARELAEQNFGSFANDIMQHRKEIRQLLETRNEALDRAKKTGIDELKKRTETQQREKQEVTKFIGETWQTVNKEVLDDAALGSFFKPVEGDDQGNAMLEKGFKLVDEAFAANPEDPKLTPDQRKDIIKKHAAIRNRAAAFGRMRHQIKAKDSRIAELEKKLAEYEKSEPTTQGSEEVPNTQATGSAWDSVRADLRKRAR